MRAVHISDVVDSSRRLLAAIWYRRGWRFRFAAIAAVLLLSASVGVAGLSGWLSVPRVHAATAGVSGTPGNLYGWGLNGDGELATTTTETCSGYPCSSTPIQAPALANVIAVAGGAMHSLAALSDGSVWAWGLNEAGQVGPGIPVGTYSSTNTPVQVTGLPSNVIAVAAGEYHSLALTSSGAVYAWGGDWMGELGPSGFPNSAGYTQNPVQVTGLPAGIVAIAAGGEDSLALASDGTVWTWGSDSYGQLGSSATAMCGSYPCSATPQQVPGLSGMTAIAAGYDFDLALTQNGTVYAWGDNSYGQLGNGSVTASSSPVQVNSLANVTVIAAGTHSMALTGSGQVYAWGEDQSGELGASTTQICQGLYLCSTTPLLVGSLPSNVSAVAVGGDYSLALAADGTVYSWGDNSLGALGLGSSDTNSHPIPTPISGVSGVTAVATGDHHALAIVTSSSGTVSQAVASLSASAFDFGDQQLTTTSQPQTFTLTNTGNTAMTISGAALTGANPGDFALTSTTCVGTPSNPVTIQPSGSCAIDVTFAPTATGTRSATLSVTCSAVNCPLNGSVTGAGIDPVAGYSPASLSFGDQQTSTSSAAQIISLSNSGTTPLTVSTIALTNPSDFSYTAPTLPFSVAPGSSVSVDVVFHPMSGDTGARAGALTFYSNDNLRPNSVSLSGNGINPSGAVSPTSLSFANQYVGATSAAQTVTVSNSGTTDLVISGVSLGGANPGDFAYSAPSLPITIAPGASAGIGVTFAPTAVGSRAATLTIASNDSLHALSVALSGTGLPPADNALSLSASPNPVRSGSHLTYTITVTNTGPGDASGIQVTDAVPSGTTFSKVTTTYGSCAAPAAGGTGTVTCTASSLAAGSSFSITLVVNVKAANGTTLSDTASVSAVSYDPNASNNSASVTTSVSKH